MLPGTRNETSFLGLFSDLAHGLTSQNSNSWVKAPWQKLALVRIIRGQILFFLSGKKEGCQSSGSILDF